MDPIGFQDRVDQTWVQGAHPEVLPGVQAHGDVDEEGEEEVLCSTSFKQYFIQHFVLTIPRLVIKKVMIVRIL